MLMLNAKSKANNFIMSRQSFPAQVKNYDSYYDSFHISICNNMIFAPICIIIFWLVSTNRFGMHVGFELT